MRKIEQNLTFAEVMQMSPVHPRALPPKEEEPKSVGELYSAYCKLRDEQRNEEDSRSRLGEGLTDAVKQLKAIDQAVTDAREALGVAVGTGLEGSAIEQLSSSLEDQKRARERVDALKAAISARPVDENAREKKRDQILTAHQLVQQRIALAEREKIPGETLQILYRSYSVDIANRGDDPVGWSNWLARVFPAPPAMRLQIPLRSEVLNSYEVKL